MMRTAEAMLDDVALLCKAMGNPHRVEIIKQLLHNKELSLGEIASHLDIELSVVSKHLKILCRVGLVKRRRVGVLVMFSKIAVPDGLAETVRGFLEPNDG